MNVNRWHAELTLDARAELGEGPTWDPDSGTLIWVDIPPGRLHRFDPRTATDDFVDIGRPLSAAVPRRAGGLVLVVREGVGLLEDTRFRLISEIIVQDDGVRMNDGACDSAGRFWVGSMHTDDLPGRGALYRVDGSWSAEKVLEGVTISNGIGWSPDETVMYYVDSLSGGVDGFDFDVDRGTIANRRRVVSIGRDVGLPDGLAVDADGCIWVALWDGGSVRRYSPTGEMIGVIDVPAARVTSCAFGGDDLSTLYITTARHSESDAHHDLGGALFSAQTGIPGLPTYAFVG